MNPPPWDAPRAAYLLTAAVADNAAQVGAIVPGDEVSAEWTGYDRITQLEILAALGAQTRLALTMAHDRLDMEIEMEWDCAARQVCSEALAATRELISSGHGPLAAPECAHCRQIIARAMCSLQIRAYFRLGFTPAMIAAMCRRSAAVETSPARQ